MRLTVNGVRLYFDVDGCALVPDGPRMVERPTIVVLHGGPGADHSLFKPDFAAAAEFAQVVYLDQRGSGRSDRELDIGHIGHQPRKEGLRRGLLEHADPVRKARYYDGMLYFLGLLYDSGNFRIWPPARGNTLRNPCEPSS